MARIRGFGRPRPLPEVEAHIAQLSEELSLTAAFVHAMHRRGEDRAAAAAIDEQRNRLVVRQRAMLRQLARPRNHRIHAALAGLAAAVLVGSASFAGYRALTPGPANQAVIHSATVRLAEAQAAQDPATVAQIIGDVHRSLLSLSPQSLVDTRDRDTVTQLLAQELQIIQSKAADAPALVNQVTSIARQLNVDVPKLQPDLPKPVAPPPSAAPAQESSPQTQEPSTGTSAPAP